jgi:hypothetical protein
MRVDVATAVRGTYCREKKEEGRENSRERRAEREERRKELVVMVRRGIGQS